MSFPCNVDPSVSAISSLKLTTVMNALSLLVVITTLIGANMIINCDSFHQLRPRSFSGKRIPSFSLFGSLSDAAEAMDNAVDLLRVVENNQFEQINKILKMFSRDLYEFENRLLEEKDWEGAVVEALLPMVSTLNAMASTEQLQSKSLLDAAVSLAKAADVGGCIVMASSAADDLHAAGKAMISAVVECEDRLLRLDVPGNNAAAVAATIQVAGCAICTIAAKLSAGAIY